MLEQGKLIIKARFTTLLWLRWTSESLFLTCTAQGLILEQPLQREKSHALPFQFGCYSRLRSISKGIFTGGRSAGRQQSSV